MGTLSFGVGSGNAWSLWTEERGHLPEFGRAPRLLPLLKREEATLKGPAVGQEGSTGARSRRMFVWHRQSFHPGSFVHSCSKLKTQMEARTVFEGFTEGGISFQPTYKYDPGSDDWDTR